MYIIKAHVYIDTINNIHIRYDTHTHTCALNVK